MAWSTEIINKVWEKAKKVENQDPHKWCKDECGAWIGRSDYGNRNSQYGWEIDHISPDGGDVLSNLRPLQWENNVDKGEGRLKCNVKASSNKNIKQ
ncbi:MAG: HNH endonuclease [bacterium]